MLKEKFSSKEHKQKWRWRWKTSPATTPVVEVPMLPNLNSPEPRTLGEAEKLGIRVRIVWSVVLGVLSIFAESGRMVRLVAPGVRPLERHEFENRSRFDLRQFGGGSF